MITKDNPFFESSAFLDPNKGSVDPFEGQTSEEILESTKEMIRQNYQFSLFSLLPGIVPEGDSLKKAAKKLGIGEDLGADFSSRLIRAGLWILRPDGRVETNFEHLSLGDISVKDYLAMTISIIAHLSDSKSYEYDTMSLVTNRQHIRQFVSKVNSALRELHEKSFSTRDENDILFSWTHTGVVEMEMKKKTAKNASKEDLT